MTQTSLHPSTSDITSSTLARALRANAVFSTASGVGLAVASPAIDEWSGVPLWLLVAVGVGLLGYAAVLLVGSRRADLVVATGRSAVAGDIGWCVGAAVLIAATSWLTTPGELALAGLSIPVAVLAAWQWHGLRVVDPGES